MLCQLCKKHCKRPKRSILGTFGRKATWVDEPCTSFRLDSIVRHQRSESHSEAMKAEATLAGKSSQRLLRPDENVATNSERKAFIGYLRCMYWLTKEEVAQSTKFPSIINLAKSLGCEYLNDLQVGRNVHYTSQGSIQKIVQCLSKAVQDPIVSAIQDSSLFTILIDETTDVTVKKQLIMYCRFVDPATATPRVCYIGMLPICDGKADTITAKIEQKLKELDLDIQHMVAIGSDGASVMLGRHSGVSARLKREIPWLIANHCVAHRLALAAGQASSKVAYLQRFKSIINQLYTFYSRSTNKSAALSEIQVSRSECRTTFYILKNMQLTTYRPHVLILFTEMKLSIKY